MTDDDFRTFVVRERKRLVSYVRSRLAASAEVDPEDIVQDVLVRFIERRDALSPLENVVAYTYAALRNRIIDVGRLKKPTLSIDDDTSESGSSFMKVLADARPGALETLQSEQGREALFEGLARLSDIERQVVVAHEFEGVPFKVLAADTGIPRNTLLSHKARALKKLRDYLQSEEMKS